MDFDCLINNLIKDESKLIEKWIKIQSIYSKIDWERLKIVIHITILSSDFEYEGLESESPMIRFIGQHGLSLVK